MKPNLAIFLMVAAIGFGDGCRADMAPSGGFYRRVPLLDELAGDWQTASDLFSLPALASTQGSAQAAHDVLSIGNASFPPITLSGETGSLSIDGQAPRLERTRWFPYEVRRTATAGALRIETAVRMLYERRGILFQVSLTNSGASTDTFDLAIGLSAATSRHERWGWKLPRPVEPGRFSAVMLPGRRSLALHDSRGELANCFAFERAPDGLSAEGERGLARWRIRLGSGKTRVVNYVLAFGENDASVRASATQWSDGFDREWNGIQTDWQGRFDAMFQPKNRWFSGHLPVLVTPDPRIRRVYYMSIVSLLSMYRTCFPTAPRVYVSNSPESNCTMMYFWDTREWATTLALLDPAMMRRYLTDWLAKGIYDGYAEEYLTGTLKGPWYSANDYSIFVLLDAYLNVTGDRAFLRESAGGHTVLDQVDSISTHWKSLVRPGRSLADYGSASNLLECVPTYIHEVASFNAANVWMMRRVAALRGSFGETRRPAELLADAQGLLPAVMDLYEPGGVWDARHRDGTRVQIRHVFDFATIGLTIPGDLTPKMRDEMAAFVEKELLTDHWMRAQSLSDVAANRSLRPDHGPMGAYCAWPPETMAALCEMGKFPEALDFLQRSAAVTTEGPYSQSRALLGRTRSSETRIAPAPQPYNASNGGAFAETIIREFFGFQPDLLGGAPIRHPQPRGFRGRLLDVRLGDSSVDLTSDSEGLSSHPPK